MKIELSYHLDTEYNDEQTNKDRDAIVEYYQLDDWRFLRNSAAVRFFASGDAALLKLNALKADIEAGTVWEPPEEPSTLTIIGVNKDTKTITVSGTYNPAAAPEPSDYEEAKKYTEFVATQTPKKGDFWHMGKLMASSHDWHHDGNNWACLVCGSKFDPMTPTCSGINAADWAVPVWETEPAPVWKHGLCLGCQCELSPAMDGEGAVECNRCSR